MDVKYVPFEMWLESNPEMGEMECPTCEGLGEITCPECRGTGQVACSECENYEDCEECEGEGTYQCPDCGGDGIVNPRDLYDDQKEKDKKRLERYYQEIGQVTQ